jgi:hypothetical protein
MTLTERYLKAVAAQLPRSERDDIVAELADAIQARMEDREEALGRPLTDAEQEAVLREVGHPLTVAARYGSGPMHVVGPELYPWWMFGVKVALFALVVVTAIGLAVDVLSGGNFSGREIGHAFHALWTGAITIIGIATLAGFIIERQKEKPSFLRDWRVKDLGMFEIAGFDAEGLSRSLGQGSGPARKGVRGQGWSGAAMSPAARGVASAVGWGVFLLWWTGLLTARAFQPYDVVTIDGISYGPQLIQTLGLLYWPVAAYAMARITFGLARAATPASVRLVGFGDTVLSLARATGFGWIWLASPVSPVVRVDSLNAFIDRSADMVSTGDWRLSGLLTIVVVVGFATSLFEASGGLSRLIRGKPALPGQEG